MNLEQRILQSIPLLAPIPTAWMVYSACVTVLDFPIGVAFPAALVVEGLGFTAIRLASAMREYNRHLNAIEIKQKMQAPAAQAYGVAGLYVIVVLAMTTVLHIFPSIAIFAPVPFIFMSVAGAWLWSLYADQVSRQEKWLEGRSQRRSAKVRDAGNVAPARSVSLSAIKFDVQRTQGTQIYRCKCGFTTPNRFVMSGHKGKCGTYQEMKSGQPIPVDLTTLEKQR